MADYDVSQTAGQVMGIAGMGIGLGLLAHTARGITRATEDMYQPHYHRRQRRMARRMKTTYQPRRGTFYNYRQPFW